MKIFRSDLSGKEFPVSEMVSAKTVRHSVLQLIQQDYPAFTHESLLSLGELNHYRSKAISQFMSSQLGELNEMEKTVLNSLTGNRTLTDKLDGDEEQNTTFGQRVADKVASFGGSWSFIISFSVFILLWIASNVFILMNKGFDPYPFILLNLILSCLAAFQAPVIMMSQNRQEEKDRQRAKNDYMINLKSELEIRSLHEKMDHFIMDQQLELFEIQKMQIELMNSILAKVEKIQVSGK